MNAGLTFAEAYDLRPGVALTTEQMARLTSDIVWLVAGQDLQARAAQVASGGDLSALVGRDLHLVASREVTWRCSALRKRTTRCMKG